MLAFVLSRRDFREHDQIITLYTLEQGKVEALARGVKKSISKNSPALEPFALIEADIIPGKEITHLTTAHIFEQYGAIHNNLAKLLISRYILSLTNELVDTHLPDRKIFELLHTTFVYITEQPQITSNVASAFALQLGVLLGFSPALEQCLVCGNPIQKQDVLFDIAGGGVVHTHCKTVSENVVLLSEEERAAMKQVMKGSFDMGLSFESMQKIGALIYKFLAYHSQKNISTSESVDKLLA